VGRGEHMRRMQDSRASRPSATARTGSCECESSCRLALRLVANKRGPSALLLCLLLVGCSAATRGTPNRLFPADTELQSVGRAVSEPGFSTLPAVDEIARNHVISARMYAIDIEYTEFENALLRERQRVGFWATTTALGLNGAVPLTSSSWNKNILSGAAEFVTGTQAAYNKEILLASTIQVLINTMRKSRDEVKAKIIAKRRQSILDYPLGDALADAEEYHRAGTLMSGVLEATQTTSTAARAAANAKQSIETEVIQGVAKDESYKRLRNYLYPGGRLSTERMKRVSEILAARGDQRPLWLIMANPAASDVRIQLLQEAQKPN
jgi:hypothetical protein